MAISRERKEELIQQYVERLNQSQGVILADYRGLRVVEMEQLRRAARESGGVLQVVKNRLLKRALAEAGLSLPDEWLQGPTLVAFCTDEMPATAKAMVDFAKDVPALVIKGGLLEGAILSDEQVKDLAHLPSREVLLSQVLGTINAPASQVAGVVASGIRQVLNLLQAYVDKLEGGASAPQAA
ncbi:MAG TPA: 50S ribosomal protein L10 [Anaerolineae bacterium]|nr:50S ribosomal protein L10 [Anaerolineae bacterium]